MHFSTQDSGVVEMMMMTYGNVMWSVHSVPNFLSNVLKAGYWTISSAIKWPNSDIKRNPAAVENPTDVLLVREKKALFITLNMTLKLCHLWDFGENHKNFNNFKGLCIIQTIKKGSLGLLGTLQMQLLWKASSKENIKENTNICVSIWTRGIFYKRSTFKDIKQYFGT